MPPDMVLKSIADPKAYPGTKNSSIFGDTASYRRGLFNPHVLFGIQNNQYKFKEDPFTMGRNNNPRSVGTPRLPSVAPPFI